MSPEGQGDSEGCPRPALRGAAVGAPSGAFLAGRPPLRPRPGAGASPPSRDAGGRGDQVGAPRTWPRTAPCGRGGRAALQGPRLPPGAARAALPVLAPCREAAHQYRRRHSQGRRSDVLSLGTEAAIGKMGPSRSHALLLLLLLACPGSRASQVGAPPAPPVPLAAPEDLPWSHYTRGLAGGGGGNSRASRASEGRGTPALIPDAARRAPGKDPG